MPMGANGEGTDWTHPQLRRLLASFEAVARVERSVLGVLEGGYQPGGDGRIPVDGADILRLIYLLVRSES